MEHAYDNTTEITMVHARIVNDLPIQIGFSVYSLAKLSMLEFIMTFL